jgi:hypothetical protein
MHKTQSLSAELQQADDTIARHKVENELRALIATIDSWQSYYVQENARKSRARGD